MDPNQHIINLSFDSDTPVNYWKFIPQGLLRVDDQYTETYVGQVIYSNPDHQLFHAVRIRDWIFVLERQNNDRPGTIKIGAFKNQSHYTFETHTVNSRSDLGKLLVNFIISTIWTILHPETLNTRLPGSDVCLKWELVLFTGKERESSRNLRDYRGRGMIEGGLTREEAIEYVQKQVESKHTC